MEIYIDESGTFKPSLESSSLSCVAGLIIPESQRVELFKAITQWKAATLVPSKLGNKGELKGRLLDESECAAFIKLLAGFDVIVEVVCLDMGATTDEQILKHKKTWPPKTSDDTTLYDPTKLVTLPNQLYAQMHALFTLIHQVLQVAINYYVQRIPQELSNFEWFIDAKAPVITKYEDLFEWIIKPVLHSMTKYNPIGFVDGFDYSAFGPYLMEPNKELQDIMLNNQLLGFINISAIMEKINFRQSHHNIGLQAVDVVANSIRRAMIGNLQFDGWKYLERLIIHRRHQSITVQRFGDRVSELGAPPYGGVVNFFQKYGKNMLVEPFSTY